MLPQDLQQLLNDKIPISREMGGQIVSVSQEELTLEFPLLPNRNHKGTLFGGSLYSGAALACYGLFLWTIKAEGFTTEDIVIAEGNIKYLLPVNADATIQAKWETAEARKMFFSVLRQKGKARVTMIAEIRLQNVVCAVFSGRFVARTGQSSMNH